MRYFRLITLLAVLLTLPGYGLASLMQRSCQEQMRASSPSVLAGDCCPGKADQGQGTPCKSFGDGALSKKAPCSACKAGYNCKSPQSFEPTSVQVLLVMSVEDSLSASPPPLLLSHGPTGLWRPPRFV